MAKNISVIQNGRSVQHYGTAAYPSFWKTITESPQWMAWEAEQAKRLHVASKNKDAIENGLWDGVYDMAECVECGWISQTHFQDFLAFVSLSTMSKGVNE